MSKNSRAQKSENSSIFFSHIGYSGGEGNLSIPESMLHPPKVKTGSKETPADLLHQPLQGLPLCLWSSVSDSEHCHSNGDTHTHTEPILQN